MKILFRRKVLSLLLCSLVFSQFSSSTYAADYPNNSIKMVIPFASGGAPDFYWRILAIRLG